jgi:LAO/AO transport system kinase
MAEAHRGRGPRDVRPGPDLDQLLAGIAERNVRSLARAISVIENGGPLREELIGQLYEKTGSARVVGITGPPGAGKSTIVDRMAQLLREEDFQVGILAVDPTSPYTGGAILGDRIRMQKLYTDPGVFIRSMATRGAMGGLARATLDAVDLLDAAGFDWILVETVGVGQDEVDVVRCVDSVLVVTLPGLGDDIQAIKAGIMEIADLFIVNKADRDGTDRAVRDLEMVLGLVESRDWHPPILKTVASRGEGLADLLIDLRRHQEWLHAGAELESRRRSRLRLRVENLLKERVLRRVDEMVGLERELRLAFDARSDPYTVADRLFKAIERPAANESQEDE